MARETVEGVALVNALRVEPELGSPARGGLPATIARRTETGWRLCGRKIYSTGAPILKWYAVWARTDEAETRVGLFLVPAGLPGTRIVETWDHLGLRASGSHDVIFEDVVFPLDHEIDVRLPDEWRTPDFTQATVGAIFISAIYDGVARAARDWLVGFLKERVPANLGAPLASLPRAQEVLGGIEARLAVNARLIGSFADDFDDNLPLSAIESNIVKLTVTNNAVAVVEDALSLTGNHGLSRTNPLQRHYRDALCGRVHTPQDDTTRISAGRARARPVNPSPNWSHYHVRRVHRLYLEQQFLRDHRADPARFSIRPTSRRWPRHTSLLASTARCWRFIRPRRTRCRSASTCSASPENSRS